MLALGAARSGYREPACHTRGKAAAGSRRVWSFEPLEPVEVFEHHRTLDPDEPLRMLNHDRVERVEDLASPDRASEARGPAALCAGSARSEAAVEPGVRLRLDLPVWRNARRDVDVRRVLGRIDQRDPRIRELVLLQVAGEKHRVVGCDDRIVSGPLLPRLMVADPETNVSLAVTVGRSW